MLNGEVLNEENVNSNSLSPFAKAAWAFFGLVQIHPFSDGNGRLSRLVATYVLLKSDFPILFPLVAREDDSASNSRSAYISAIRQAEASNGQDLTPLVYHFENSAAETTAWLRNRFRKCDDVISDEGKSTAEGSGNEFSNN